MHILLIEDDETTAAALVETLTAHRYLVSHARDGQAGYEMAQINSYDLLLLDIVLPKLDGITLCRKLRSEGYQFPILLITARDTSTDRVVGLDAGADDYVVKPFDLPELLARIRALVRRGLVNRSPLLTWGPLTLDPTSQEVTVDGTPLHLTRKEYSLLELFLQNPKRAFSRSLILDRLWSFDESPGEDTVTTHIKDLRQRLKRAGVPDLIETVYGLGYRLKASPPVSSPAPPETDRNTVTVALQKIWDRSQPSVEAQLRSLEEAQTAFLTDRLDSKIQQQAKRDAHKLAGSVGIFGFAEGSQWARELEMLLTEPLSKAEIPQFQTLLTALRQALAQSPSPTQAIDAQPEPSSPLILLISKEIGGVGSVQSAILGKGLRVRAIDPSQLQRETREGSPHAILLDLSLTDSQEGLRLLTEVTSQYAAVPVLVILEQDSLGERVEIARRGAALCLQKPLLPDRVVDAILHLLETRPVHPVKVLVVDDDALTLDAVQTLLEPWGMAVIPLQISNRFWEVMNQVKPDLLILDVEMPDFNGVELCQVVRNDGLWGNLPIVVLTAHTDAETIRRIFAAGADDYISKPFVGPELVTRILSRIERVRYRISSPDRPTLSSL